MAFGFETYSADGFLQIDAKAKSYKIIASGTAAFTPAYSTDYRVINFPEQPVAPLVFISTGILPGRQVVVSGDISYGFNVNKNNFTLSIWTGNYSSGGENYLNGPQNSFPNLYVDYIVVVPVTNVNTPGSYGLKLFGEDGASVTFDSNNKFFGVDNITSFVLNTSSASLFGTTFNVAVPPTPAGFKRYTLVSSLMSPFGFQSGPDFDNMYYQVMSAITYMQTGANQITYMTGSVSFEGPGNSWNATTNKLHVCISGVAKP